MKAQIKKKNAKRLNTNIHKRESKGRCKIIKGKYHENH